MKKFVDFHFEAFWVFSSLSFQVYLEINAHNHHELTLENVREYDSEIYSKNEKKESILEGSS